MSRTITNDFLQEEGGNVQGMSFELPLHLPSHLRQELDTDIYYLHKVFQKGEATSWGGATSSGGRGDSLGDRTLLRVSFIFLCALNKVIIL